MLAPDSFVRRDLRPVLQAAQTIGSWLAANWGNVASIVGLAASAVAAYRARRAQEAAEAARGYALTRSMAEELTALNKTASELLTHVRGDRTAAAELRAKDLLESLSYVMRRWSDQLGEDGTNRLLQSRVQLEVIHEMFVTHGPLHSMTPEGRVALAKACRSVSAAFAAETGRAVKRSADEGLKYA
jgi:hypothetical protein